MNKADVNKYLSDKDIRIGMEIEFVIPKFEKDHESEIIKLYNYQDMTWEYDLYTDALAEWYENDGKKPPKVPKWAKKMGYKNGEDIPDPEEFMSSDMKRYFRSLIKYFRADKLPFQYIISSENFYHNKEKWVLKPDSTIGLAGIEISSPVLTLPQFLDICPKIFRHIDMYGGKTNDDCGFHIGLSINNQSWYKRLNVLKMGTLVDEKYIYKRFPNRVNNEYARSVHSDIKELINNNDKIVDRIKEKSYKRKPKFTESHHLAINIEHLSQKNKYVEFRYIGGKDYHHRWCDIKKLTAHYIRAIRWGCSEYRNDFFIKKMETLQRRARRYADV